MRFLFTRLSCLANLYLQRLFLPLIPILSLIVSITHNSTMIARRRYEHFPDYSNPLFLSGYSHTVNCFACWSDFPVSIAGVSLADTHKMLSLPNRLKRLVCLL